MMRSGILTLLALSVSVVACGDRSEAQGDDQVRELAHRLLPDVERAVGLAFRREPTIAIRTQEQVKAYLVRKLDDEYGKGDFEKATLAYRLFGMLPDTVDLRELLLALYTEQIVGYYDPDSTTLYVVEGALPTSTRLTLAHELVHALQGQYVVLDSLLALERQNDRRMAVQAVMEGQATLASLRVLMPDKDLESMPELWRDYRNAVRRQQQQMPVFASAPLVIRETLIFPYLAGADFVRWFERQHGDTVPFGPRLPTSTEQILHPDRYDRGDGPIELAFEKGTEAVYDDGLGEFEIRILLTELSGSESLASAGARDWGGDRYAVFDAGGEQYALVWWTVWDTERAAGRFATLLSREWAKRRTPGRRSAVERVDAEGQPAVRFVDAPEWWPGWAAPPRVVVVR